MSVERSKLSVERSAPRGAVFLSYASQDAEAAKRICDVLRAAGVEVWFDQSELVGGDQWDGKIRGQISSCALFVPVISAATQARGEGYFRLEWKLAVDRSHLMAHDQPFLLPVVIDATADAAARVPPEFRTVQWTKLMGGETPPAFCVRVQKLLGGEAVGGALRPDASEPSGRKAGPLLLGKFIQTLNYTAPNASIVHVEIGARDGKNAYVNIDSPFAALPAALIGADWVQADNRDALYSAVDLMELAVASDCVVWIAHDHRLPRPGWLKKQFEPAQQTITVAGQKLDLYRHPAKAGESLTLGANTETTSITEGNMYLVFVNSAGRDH